MFVELVERAALLGVGERTQEDNGPVRRMPRTVLWRSGRIRTFDGLVGCMRQNGRASGSYSGLRVCALYLPSCNGHGDFSGADSPKVRLTVNVTYLPFLSCLPPPAAHPQPAPRPTPYTRRYDEYILLRDLDGGD